MTQPASKKKKNGHFTSRTRLNLKVITILTSKLLKFVDSAGQIMARPFCGIPHEHAAQYDTSRFVKQPYYVNIGFGSLRWFY